MVLDTSCMLGMNFSENEQAETHNAFDPLDVIILCPRCRKVGGCNPRRCEFCGFDLPSNAIQKILKADHNDVFKSTLYAWKHFQNKKCSIDKSELATDNFSKKNNGILQTAYQDQQKMLEVAHVNKAHSKNISTKEGLIDETHLPIKKIKLSDSNGKERGHMSTATFLQSYCNKLLSENKDKKVESSALHNTVSTSKRNADVLSTASNNLSYNNDSKMNQIVNMRKKICPCKNKDCNTGSLKVKSNKYFILEQKKRTDASLRKLSEVSSITNETDISKSQDCVSVVQNHQQNSVYTIKKQERSNPLIVSSFETVPTTKISDQYHGKNSVSAFTEGQSTLSAVKEQNKIENSSLISPPDKTTERKQFIYTKLFDTLLTKIYPNAQKHVTITNNHKKTTDITLTSSLDYKNEPQTVLSTSNCKDCISTISKEQNPQKIKDELIQSSTKSSYKPLKTKCLINAANVAGRSSTFNNNLTNNNHNISNSCKMKEKISVNSYTPYTKLTVPVKPTDPIGLSKVTQTRSSSEAINCDMYEDKQLKRCSVLLHDIRSYLCSDSFKMNNNVEDFFVKSAEGNTAMSSLSKVKLLTIKEKKISGNLTVDKKKIDTVNENSLKNEIFLPSSSKVSKIKPLPSEAISYDLYKDKQLKKCSVVLHDIGSPSMIKDSCPINLSINGIVNHLINNAVGKTVESSISEIRTNNKNKTSNSISTDKNKITLDAVKENSLTNKVSLPSSKNVSKVICLHNVNENSLKDEVSVPSFKNVRKTSNNISADENKISFDTVKENSLKDEVSVPSPRNVQKTSKNISTDENKISLDAVKENSLRNDVVSLPLSRNVQKTSNNISADEYKISLDAVKEDSLKDEISLPLCRNVQKTSNSISSDENKIKLDAAKKNSLKDDIFMPPSMNVQRVSFDYNDINSRRNKTMVKLSSSKKKNKITSLSSEAVNYDLFKDKLKKCSVLLYDIGSHLYSDSINTNDIVEAFVINNSEVIKSTIELTLSAERTLTNNKKKVPDKASFLCRDRSIGAGNVNSTPSEIKTSLILASSIRPFKSQQFTNSANKCIEIIDIANEDCQITSKKQKAAKSLKYPTVYKENLDCLAERGDLNDLVINFYLRYIYNERLTPELQMKTYICDSFFYTKLEEDYFTGENLLKASKKRDSVQEWMKGANLFSKDFILVPVNKKKNPSFKNSKGHWYLVIICYLSKLPKIRLCDDRTQLCDTEVQVIEESNNFRHRKARPCICFFDSLDDSKELCEEKIRVFRNLRKFLKKLFLSESYRCETYDWQLLCPLKVTCPQQKNNYDCGIFLLQFAESFFETPITNFQGKLDVTHWFDEKKIEGKRKTIKATIEERM